MLFRGNDDLVDMNPTEGLFFEDRIAWRRWLEKHHDKASEVWILTFKTHTKKRCVCYEKALQEALCYGWIDSRLRRIDDKRHMWRFAPRRPNSIWSLGNRRRAERLINEGRMKSPGLKKVEAAKRSGEWGKATSPSKPPRMPKELKAALMKNKEAWRNFQAFARSYRTTYIYWVSVAKMEETRKRRIEEVVRLAERNIKQGLAPA
jgi:uncharacterized protein YdeI (YjbR/CyaY-like superfamily)